jgi:aminoglycoside N3'-acetyltransferase
LYSFGILEGGVEMVFDVLRDTIGLTGTIVVPTYTYEQGIIFDRRTTSSVQSGALSEYVRLRPDAVRSLCPMHSHAGVGALKKVLLEPDGSKVFGHGSDFEALGDNGFKLVLLGLSGMDGATYLHHLEALAGVPTREWINIPRQVANPDGSNRTMNCEYFGRKNFRKGEPHTACYDELELQLLATGCMLRANAVYDTSYSIMLQDLHKIGMELLSRNPLAFEGANGRC